MDQKVKEVLDKVKETAYAAGKATESVASKTSKKAGEAFETTKLSLKNFDLKTDIELLYKEIGRMVYLTHTGEDIDAEYINTKIDTIDIKFKQISENKKRIAYLKTVITCPECGKACKREDAFCRACGYKF